MAQPTPDTRPEPVAVEVTGGSEPVLCAEKDNVYLKLISGEARRFTVEAAHPAYIGTIVVDRWAPDFTHCDMSKDPVFQFEKRRQNERALGESRMRKSQSRVLDDHRRLPEQQVDVQRPRAEWHQAGSPMTLLDALTMPEKIER